jgi:hypothetical protein
VLPAGIDTMPMMAGPRRVVLGRHAAGEKQLSALVQLWYPETIYHTQKRPLNRIYPISSPAGKSIQPCTNNGEISPTHAPVELLPSPTCFFRVYSFPKNSTQTSELATKFPVLISSARKEVESTHKLLSMTTCINAKGPTERHTVQHLRAKCPTHRKICRS